MNFAALYAKVIQKLGESSTPQFWSEAELKDYINRGIREFVRQTGSNTVKNMLTHVENGRYLVPDNLLMLGNVYYAGRPLERRSVDYLDSRNSGTSHYDGIVGDGIAFSDSDTEWRNTTGTPEAWYYEDSKICLFPIPETLAAAVSTIRVKQTGALPAGATTIALTQAFSSNTNLTDFFLRGVFQDSGWSISGSTLTLTESLPVDSSYTIVGYPSTSSTTIQKTYKQVFTAGSGQKVFRVARGFVMGANALTVSINGITQDPSSYTEISNYSIELDDAPTTGSSVAITVGYYSGGYPVEARYALNPVEMTDDGDSPDMPEMFHDAGWTWACFEALSREGRGKDEEKSSLYAQLFTRIVNSWMQSFGEKPGPQYPDMPFMV